MKIIVAGSRSITDYWRIAIMLDNLASGITELVSGNARGIDMLGEMWAAQHNIPVTIFQANWDDYGKKAGILRNIDMGNYADKLIAFWDGNSPGTKHMIDYMKTLNKPVEVRIIE